MSYEHYRILLRSQWWDTLGSESIKLHSRWEIIRRLRLPKGDGLQCHIQSFCAAQTCFRCDLVSTRSWWSVLCNTSLNSYHVTRSRLHSPHSLSSKGSNYQRRMLLISVGAIEGHFEGKTPREGHQGGSCSLHDNAPAHRALVTQKKLAYLGFHCLDHPPYSPDLAPSDYHLFPGLKKIERL